MSCAISACAASGRWAAALQLLRRALETSARPNVICAADPGRSGGSGWDGREA